MSGPLEGLKIVELAGIGPGPYACMLLADLGADVIRLERGDPSASRETSWDLLNRSRFSVAVDLKNEAGRDLVLELCEQADALVEGFRPGVAERLGLGPEDVWRKNPGLVYARMTGYGQDGPLAQRAGHDINYIAISGALWPLGRAGERRRLLTSSAISAGDRCSSLWDSSRGSSTLARPVLVRWSTPRWSTDRHRCSP